MQPAQEPEAQPVFLSELTQIEENLQLKSSDRLWKCFFVILGATNLLLTVIPGRFAQIDEVFYKCAGYHWAATGQFAAPELVGRVDSQPGLDVVYFVYPPIYSFVFGLYTKAIGFGPHRCILFDAIIRFSLATLTISLARRVFDVPTRYACVLGTLMLFLGTSGRPDEMAMCFGILGILSWSLKLKQDHSALLSGAAFGLCGMTSIGVCFFTVPMALLVAHYQNALNIRTTLKSVLAGLIVGLLCVAPILIRHPDAYRQLLAHAQVQHRVGGMAVPGQSRWRVALHDYIDSTLGAARLHSDMFSIPLGALLVIAVCLVSRTAKNPRFLLQGTFCVLGGMTFLWLIFPGRALYLWFFAPWLLSITVSLLRLYFPSLHFRSRALVIVIIVVCSVISLRPYAMDRIVMLLLPKEQTMDANYASIRQLIPAGARVVTLDYWWALADKCQVLDPNHSHLNPIEFDYLIETGNGSGKPGRPLRVNPDYESYAVDHHFGVIKDSLNRSPISVSGIRLTNSGYGFGPLVLGNISKGELSGTGATKTAEK